MSNVHYLKYNTNIAQFKEVFYYCVRFSVIFSESHRRFHVEHCIFVVFAILFHVKQYAFSAQ